MRVLILHGDTRNPEQGQGGGGESACADIMRSVRERGHEVAWWHGQEPLDAAVARFKPDLAHLMTLVNGPGPHNDGTHDMGPARWLLEKGIPVLWQINDYWPFCPYRNLLLPPDRTRRCAANEGACDKACGECADAEYLETLNRCKTVTFNEHTAGILRANGVHVDHIVPLGVDTDLFRPDPVQRDEHPSVYHVAAWWPYPTKGAHVLQAACQGRSWGVNVVTGAPRAKVADVLKRAHIFVFPSVYEETWGLTLTEAMASGCACVASDVAGARAQITTSMTGALVPAGDPSALADAVEFLLSDKATRDYFGQCARAQAAQEFSLPAMGKRWERCYQGVLDGNP